MIRVSGALIAGLMLLTGLLTFAGPKGQGSSPLLEAAGEGQIEALQKAPKTTNWSTLSDANGETALIKASARQQVEVVQWLLKKKVKLNSQDKAGHSALFYAISNNDTETGTLLIKGGAPVDQLQGSEKESLLFEAARLGAKDLAELILQKSPKLVDQTDSRGRTPIFEALENSQLGFAEFLLEKGASTKVKLKDGQSLLEFARAKGVSEGTDVFKMIRSRDSN